MKQFIETGKIVGTHGIKGEMRLQPWADDVESICGYKTLFLDEKGEKSLVINSARVHKNVALIVAEGVDTIEKAERLRNSVVYVRRDEIKLKPGAYLIADLIGCEVYDDEKAKLYGVIADVFSTGANDVWSIEKDKKEYLLPAIKDVVKSVDIEAERVTITPIKGIFDDEN